MDGEIVELEIEGEDGLLALVVASKYKSFVGEDWTYEQVLDHFAEQTAARNILVWECGDGGDRYRIQILKGFSGVQGFREVSGAINPSNGRIHLASYTALTMAAQFEDYAVPAADEASLFFELEATPTKIRLVQMYDPMSNAPHPEAKPHFRIEYEPGEVDGWKEVAWESNRAPIAPIESARTGSIAGLLSRLFRRGK